MLLEAFDVSAYQALDLGSLARYRAGWARASWDEHEDAAYAAHIQQIVSAGLVAVAYHAGYGDHSGQAQASFFLSVIAKYTHKPSIVVIDTREFGMTVTQCNAFIAYVHAHSTYPVLIYDSEGNWQSGYIAHEGDAVANYSRQPIRPFVFWQNEPHGGPAGGDHQYVDPAKLDALGVGRMPPKWALTPITEIAIPAGLIYYLDGRTIYSHQGSEWHGQAHATALGGWKMVTDGPYYVAVRV